MSSLTSPAPYHLLAYGTLLGSNLFQSFFAGFIQFKVLPRPQFAQLQKATFPSYFGLQTVLPLVLALTYPVKAVASTTNKWDLSAMLATERRWTVLLPVGLMFVTGLSNMVYFGPETTRIMTIRKHQETRDGKKAYDKGPHSPEMKRLNRTFAWLHGLSTVVNLVGFGAMVEYAFHLGARF